MVSVIVPTYNRTDCVMEMLKSLEKQQYRDFEVLVLDQTENVPEDKVSGFLACCSRVRYFQIDQKGRSLAKNFGISQALGDILIFCDDDIVVEENFISTHVDRLTASPLVGAMSCHLIEPGEMPFQTDRPPLAITVYGRFINHPTAVYEGPVTSLNGGNMSFKKTVLEEIGFFEERLRGTSMLEEPDIAYRVLKTNHQIHFSAATRVGHFPQHNGNINQLRQSRYNWLRDFFFNQYYFLFRNKRTIYLPLVFFFLLYRSVVEWIKSGSFAGARFMWLPFSQLRTAAKSWRKNQNTYPRPWFTPAVHAVGIVKMVSNYRYE